ncbi:hypothetical protein RYX36_008320 [Vicia faba]
MNQNKSQIVGASEFNLSDHKHPLSSPHDLMSIPVKPFNAHLLRVTRLRIQHSSQMPGQPPHTGSRILFAVGVRVSDRLQPPFTIM